MKRRAYIRLLNEKLWFDTLAGTDFATLTEWPDQLQLEWLVRPALTAAASQAGTSAQTFVTLDTLRQGLEALDPGLFDLEIVLLIGGEHCYSTQINIPSKQAKHIAQALPYMLEDQLAEDVETFQFVSGARNKEGNVSVLACNKAFVRLIAEAFRYQDVPLDAIVPDMLSLPLQEGQWTFLVDSKTLSVRTGPLVGLTIEMDALPIVVKSLLLDESQSPQQVHVIFAHRHLSDNIQAWLRTQFTNMVAGTSVQIDFSNVEDERFAVLADFLSLNGALPVNLLQGELKPIPRRRASTLNWKPTAVLAGVLALMQTTYLYAQTWQFQHQVEQINQEAIATYKRYFPQDRNIRDVKRQMEDHLRQAEKLSSGASFLALLAQTGQKVNESNRGKATPLVSLNRLSYDEAQGDLKVDLVAENYAALDAFKNQIQAIPLAVEVASASQDGEKVKARVRVWSDVK